MRLPKPPRRDRPHRANHQDRRAANDQGRKLAEVESLNFAIAGAPLIPNSPVIPAQAGIQTYLTRRLSVINSMAVAGVLNLRILRFRAFHRFLIARINRSTREEVRRSISS